MIELQAFTKELQPKHLVLFSEIFVRELYLLELLIHLPPLLLQPLFVSGGHYSSNQVLPGQQLINNEANGPHIHLAVILGVFHVKLRRLVVTSSTTNSVDGLISKCLFAEGPVNNLDENGVLAEGVYHDVAGFEIPVDDSFLLVGLVCILFHVFTVLLHLLVENALDLFRKAVGVIVGLDDVVVGKVYGPDDLLDNHEDVLLGHHLKMLGLAEIAEIAEVAELVHNV